MSALKQLLIGRPLASREEGHQRLTKRVALAVFSADAVASSAFATEEILHVLVPVAGMAALDRLIPISALVVVLLAIVVSSYRQTIASYPNGGGSYIVSRANLGERAGLVAGASLLVDYVLTVAVSIAAGTAAVTSAIPELRDYRVVLCLGFVALLTLANLRGLKESGTVFAGPTYGYIVLMGLVIVVGLFRSFTGSIHALPVDQRALADITGGGRLLGTVTLFLLMRAFSSGAVALSGVEAISNGVPAFKPPESRNAATTLTWTGSILGVLFTGVAVLAVRLRPTLSNHETILSVLTRTSVGTGPLYGIVQAATASILILSANTAFADFPRLSAILATDGYMPRQLAHRGDRLVFSNGIVALAAASGGLLLAFDGVTTRLVPLFAVGLFASFTLSQAGMVRHHLNEREVGWRWKLVVNATGAMTTLAVLVVVAVSKFTEGAWIPILVIPIIVLCFVRVSGHYRKVARALYIEPSSPRPQFEMTVIVPVSGVHRGVLMALDYARAMHPTRLLAVTVATDDDDAERMKHAWADHHIDVPLEIVHSPYRDLGGPLLEFIDRADSAWADDIVTVVLPEFVIDGWWGQVLHNQSALGLKARLLLRPKTVVTSVPIHIADLAPASDPDQSS